MVKFCLGSRAGQALGFLGHGGEAWGVNPTMALEQALTEQVTGQLILDHLYAHEQVVTFSTSWELRKTFLGDIFEIRAGLNLWFELRCEEAWHAALEAHLAELEQRDDDGAGSNSS